MKVLFDTSVLVAALIASHPMHALAFPWLKQAHAGQHEFLVAAHSLAELYSVLTTLPVRPRIGPGLAWQLIHYNVESTARIVALSAADYGAVLRDMAHSGVTGGAIYDALIVQAAQKSGVERLLTFNANDFSRIWPSGAGIVTAP